MCRLPYTLAVFAVRPHDEVCERRRELAKTIMVTKLRFLEANTRKLMTLFADGFAEAAESGTTTSELWLVCQGLRTMVLSDVQRNEGLNSLIKSTIKRNKGIKLPALSARICVRAQLGMANSFHGGNKVSKFSDIKATASNLLKELGQYTSDGKRIMADSGRFTTPDPAVIPADDRALNMCVALAEPETSAATPAYRWAALRTILVGRAIKKLSPRECFRVEGALQKGSHLFFACDRNYSIRHFTVWEVIEDIAPDATRAKIGIILPMVHKASIDILASCYEDFFAEPAEGSAHPPQPPPLSVKMLRHRVKLPRQASDGRFISEIELSCGTAWEMTKELPKALKQAAARAKKSGKDIWSALDEVFSDHSSRPADAILGGPADPGEAGVPGVDAAAEDDTDCDTIAADDPILVDLAARIVEHTSGDEELDEKFDELLAEDSLDIGEDAFVQHENDKIRAELERRGVGGKPGDGDAEEGYDPVAELHPDERDSILAKLAFSGAKHKGADHRDDDGGDSDDPGGGWHGEIDHTVWDRWLAELDASLAAMLAAVSETKPVGGLRLRRGRPPELSLVSALWTGIDNIVSRDIFYIAWVDPAGFNGRRCDVKPNGEVKYSVTLFKAKKWTEADELIVLHPATGVAMEKTSFDRPVVPEGVQRLRDCLQSALECSLDGPPDGFGWGKMMMKDH